MADVYRPRERRERNTLLNDMVPFSEVLILTGIQVLSMVESEAMDYKNNWFHYRANILIQL